MVTSRDLSLGLFYGFGLTLLEEREREISRERERERNLPTVMTVPKTTGGKVWNKKSCMLAQKATGEWVGAFEWNYFKFLKKLNR